MRKRISAAIAAAALMTGVGLTSAAPANAADTAIVNLADTPSIQADTSRMSFVDSGGNTFTLDVTTTWQRLSATQAELRTIVVRPVDFPRGDCLSLDIGSTGEIGYQSLGRTLCPTGYLTYSPNVTATASSGDNLGQLTLSTPDPFSPFSGGARWMYIEYHS